MAEIVDLDRYRKLRRRRTAGRAGSAGRRETDQRASKGDDRRAAVENIEAGRGRPEPAPEPGRDDQAAD